MFIRLSARVDAEDTSNVSPRSEDEAYVTASEDIDAEDVAPKVMAADDIDDDASLQAFGTSKNSKKATHKSESSQFSHKNPYALLEDLSFEEEEEDDDENLEDLVEADNSIRPTKPRPLPLLPTHMMIPKEGSRFWIIYSNNLRVNGTVEGDCPIWKAKGSWDRVSNR